MRPIRILMGKVGLDGHDRGAKVVMSALRDAGMEVIYSGLHQSPKALVRAALEEDVQVLGLSILSGAHNDLVPRVIKALKDEKMKLPVIVGGIIPDPDISGLKKMGVAEVFTPGTRLDEIVEKVRALGSPSSKTLKKETSKKKAKKKKPTKKKASKKKASKKKAAKKRRPK